ncbi:hypothetical protein TNCT_685421, partial [Trichonephila clavata]
KTEIIGILTFRTSCLRIGKCHIAQQASRHTNLFTVGYKRPIETMKEVWTGDKEIPTGSSKSVEEYLRDLTGKLKQAHNLARGNSEKHKPNMQVDTP